MVYVPELHTQMEGVLALCKIFLIERGSGSGDSEMGTGMNMYHCKNKP